MAVRTMKLSSRAIGRVAALALAGVSLAGCVYYPSGYGYYSSGYGYYPYRYSSYPYGYSYYPYSYGYVPSVGVTIGGGWGNYWGGHYYRGGRYYRGYHH